MTTREKVALTFVLVGGFVVVVCTAALWGGLAGGFAAGLLVLLLGILLAFDDAPAAPEPGPADDEYAR